MTLTAHRLYWKLLLLGLLPALVGGLLRWGELSSANQLFRSTSGWVAPQDVAHSLYQADLWLFGGLCVSAGLFLGWCILGLVVRGAQLRGALLSGLVTAGLCAAALGTWSSSELNSGIAHNELGPFAASAETSEARQANQVYLDAYADRRIRMGSGQLGVLSSELQLGFDHAERTQLLGGLLCLLAAGLFVLRPGSEEAAGPMAS